MLTCRAVDERVAVAPLLKKQTAKAGRRFPDAIPGKLDTEVAAMVEQVEQKRLAIVFDGDRR